MEDWKPENILDAFAVWGPFWRDTVGSVQLPWDDTAYQNLQRTIEAVPAGAEHDLALALIGRLDCDNPDKTLAPCQNAQPPSASVAGFHAAANDKDYRKALAGRLKSIVCTGYDDSIFVLRGIAGFPIELNGRLPRLAATGAEVTALIDFIMSPACPVSANLTDADRARLQKMKEDALKEPGG